jgi:hypothetical protein
MSNRQGSTPQHDPDVHVTAGSFHSMLFSRMKIYLLASRFRLTNSLSSQQGHKLPIAQHAGAWQHTKHPLVFFPGANESTIAK